MVRLRHQPVYNSANQTTFAVSNFRNVSEYFFLSCPVSLLTTYRQSFCVIALATATGACLKIVVSMHEEIGGALLTRIVASILYCQGITKFAVKETVYEQEEVVTSSAHSHN